MKEPNTEVPRLDSPTSQGMWYSVGGSFNPFSVYEVKRFSYSTILRRACARKRTATLTLTYFILQPLSYALNIALEGCMTVDNSSISSPVKDRADYDIFFSYSRRDKDFVRQLWEALTQANQNTWVDWDDIPPTADWRSEIYVGIEAANSFVFVISPHSISSVVCGEELTHAIAHFTTSLPLFRGCRFLSSWVEGLALQG